MAKVYKVMHSGESSIVWADGISQVRAWILRRFKYEIVSATPEDVFNNRGKYVNLVEANGKDKSGDASEANKENSLPDLNPIPYPTPPLHRGVDEVKGSSESGGD